MVNENETWNKFSFKGSKKRCDNMLPHAPHVVGHYNTESYGRLEYYCPGMSGNGFRVHNNGGRNGTPSMAGRMFGEWTFDPMGECTHVLQQVEVRDYAGRDYWKVVYQQKGYRPQCVTVVGANSEEAWAQARGIANFSILGKVISVDKLPVEKTTICVDVSPRYVFTGTFDNRDEGKGFSLVLDVSDESGEHQAKHAWLSLPSGFVNGQKIKFSGAWKEHMSRDKWIYGPRDIELLGEDGKPLASQCGMGCA